MQGPITTDSILRAALAALLCVGISSSLQATTIAQQSFIVENESRITSLKAAPPIWWLLYSDRSCALSQGWIQAWRYRAHYREHAHLWFPRFQVQARRPYHRSSRELGSPYSLPVPAWQPFPRLKVECRRNVRGRPSTPCLCAECQQPHALTPPAQRRAAIVSLIIAA